jgi:hypothetical protein
LKVKSNPQQTAALVVSVAAVALVGGVQVIVYVS